MNDDPRVDDLLGTARETLLRELLPQLPAEAKYPALMVANAMGIAARECADGTREDAVRALFETLYGEDFDADAVQDEPASMTAASARLVRDIRSGDLDDKADIVLPALRRAVLARLRVSSPKYLDRAGLR